MVERKLHVGIIASNLIACTSTNHQENQPHQKRTRLSYFCFPCRLREVPGKFGECTRGQNSSIYEMILFGLIPLISIGIIVITGMLYHHAISRERYFRVSRENTDVAGASQEQQDAFSLSRLYRREMGLQAGILIQWSVSFSVPVCLIFYSGVTHIGWHSEPSCCIQHCLERIVSIGRFFQHSRLHASKRRDVASSLF